MEFASTWDTRDSLYLLRNALEAFALSQHKPHGWAHRRVHDLSKCRIDSIEKLELACRSGTVNFLLENNLGSTLSEETVKHLDRFLPGEAGRICLELAQEAVERVENGSAITKYVHRHNSVKVKKEVWDISYGNNIRNPQEEEPQQWTMHVDCAGFVRNILETILEAPFMETLSDRPFMRAKDFFTFFDYLPSTTSDLKVGTATWRRVDDLRQILPGDILCYRVQGRAAGKSVFTTKKDQKAKEIFTSLKTAQYYEEVDENEGLVTRNLAQDAYVKQWVSEVCSILESLNITDYDSIMDNLEMVKEILAKRGESDDTLELLEEVMESQHKNTGHIMICAGPSEPNRSNPNEWRVPVYHSTKSKIKPGVQRGYKRIVSSDYKNWYRNVGDVDVDGDNDVIVTAARMCF